jgi:formate hydrogenlyase subunit 3/multisubunit Na+/H+ antiporter MnhD subunit
MNEIIRIIIVPLLAGLLLLLIPDNYRTVKGICGLIVSIVICWLSFSIYRLDLQVITINEIPGLSHIPGLDNILQDANRYLCFTCDELSKLIILFISVIAILILLYSLIFPGARSVRNYYSWILITLGCSFGAVLSDNLLLFLTFWGILGITLYKLISGQDKESSSTAKKTLIIIGASDSIMIIGIALLWKLTGSLSINNISLPTNSALSITAFLLLLAGSFAKAGAFPFHTWVPDYARDAPATSSALLPASLDKLLGIYFLARITNWLFILSDTMRLLLLIIGTITIITAVMMALVQHDYKRLLGFHAVSQVGYMILGFGLGSLIGIAAGLFHMINNVIYKSGLFLSAGCVEYRTGKKHIDDLGGLSKTMPVTFIASLIFAMSISGIPPFNGFASKWMIYQGIIEFGTGHGIASSLWVVWLGFAVLGSALTLASFIKFVGGVFLGRQRTEFNTIREVPALMYLPLICLALICVFFGVFATGIVVPQLFMPVTGVFKFTGIWDSSLVSLMVLVSIVLGLIIYISTGANKFRVEDSFIGGEKIHEETGFPAPEFYKTITEFRLFGWLYGKAEEKLFDIYDLSRRFVLWVSQKLSEGHPGILPGYVIWVCAGLILMLIIMI